MLNKVKFPLTNAQLSRFFLDNDYTDYFTLQKVLSELTESHLISIETIRNTSYYHITSDGGETLGFFVNRIPGAIMDDMDSFLMKNKYELRNEVGTIADYYKSTNQDYIVHCQVKEGKSTLIELNDAQLALTQAKLSESQAIYNFVVAKAQLEQTLGKDFVE